MATSNGLFGNMIITVKGNSPAPQEPTKKTKEVVAVWCDKGGYFDFALQMAKGFKKMYYWTPSYIELSEPKFRDAIHGTGFEDENIVRIKQLFTEFDDTGYKFSEVDLFIFADNYFADFQYLLISMGKKVWSGGYVENLELYRRQTKKLFKEIGLAVNSQVYINGIKELEAYLKDKKNKYIKVSEYRDMFETFKWFDWDSSHSKIDDIKFNKSSDAGELMEFIVESDIPTDYELGIDAFVVRGEFPDEVTHGFEIKNKSYIETHTPVEALNKADKLCIKKLTPVLKEFQFTGWYADEKRIAKDGTMYLTDLTLPRLPSPPHQILSRMYSNFPEIMWRGANGIMVQPKFKGKYGIMIFCGSSWNDEHTVQIKFDKDIKDNISWGYCYKLDGKTFAISPMCKGASPCSIVAIADTIKECEDKLREVEKKLYIQDIDIDLEGQILELQKVVEAAAEHDIQF